MGLLAAVGLYLPNLAGGYLSDDFLLVGLVRKVGPTGIWFHNSWFFRPQAGFLIWFGDRFGHGAWLSHSICLASFILATVILRQLVLAIASTSELRPVSAQWAATFAGLLFAFYPSHPEAVNWVSCAGDDAGLAEGALAILLALRYFKSEGTVKWVYFAGATLCFGLAMSAKEIFLPYPTLAIIMGIAFCRHLRWPQLVPRLLPLVAVDFGLVGTYVYLHNAFGNQWGYPGQMAATRAEKVRNLSYNLPNAFLPVTDWVTLGNQVYQLWPIAILTALATVLLIRRAPPLSVHGPETLKRMFSWIADHKHWLFLGWAAVNLYFAELWQTDPFNEICYLGVAAAVLFLTRRIDWNKLALLVGCVFIASCALLIPREDLLLFGLLHLAGPFAIARGKIAFLMILIYFFANRSSGWLWSENQRDWIWSSAALIACALILLLPSMGVNTSIIQWDGQGQRLAFEASMFACAGLALLFVLFFGKHPALGGGIAFTLVLAYAVHLYRGNTFWIQAGAISKHVEPEMSRVLASRPKHVYVLSNVAMTGPVAVFNMVENNLAEVAYPGSRAHLYGGLYELYHQPGDRVVLTKSDLKHFRFRLKMTRGSNEAHGPGFREGGFKLEGGDLVLQGFLPGDRIVYVDDDQLRIVL